MTSDDAFDQWWLNSPLFMPNNKSYELAYASWNAALEYTKAKRDPASWANAPDWARFKATDPDGSIYWFENRPTINIDFCDWDGNGGRCLEITVRNNDCDWQETLEEKPNV